MENITSNFQNDTENDKLSIKKLFCPTCNIQPAQINAFQDKGENWLFVCNVCDDELVAVQIPWAESIAQQVRPVHRM